VTQSEEKTDPQITQIPQIRRQIRKERLSEEKKGKGASSLFNILSSVF
jgi:hypothetical protein